MSFVLLIGDERIKYPDWYSASTTTQQLFDHGLRKVEIIKEAD